MSNPHQATITQQLQELDELYYTAPLALYEATLHLAIVQLQDILPGFTIAFAEIYAIGSERLAHGGMGHVFVPVEGSAE
ncbi:MAG TPA: hypothetical protein VKX46_20985 [Ktedonobacteraceae bacterium]|jgi:hypothetical protein|nr:hypothetical protein [Ktedonobacteraceae bacterium]